MAERQVVEFYRVDTLSGLLVFSREKKKSFFFEVFVFF